VFRNDLFELIQYAPTTGKVQAEPVLIVPAWIMKYYVLDLSPHNSLIRHLVGAGLHRLRSRGATPRRSRPICRSRITASRRRHGRARRGRRDRAGAQRSMPRATASAARSLPSRRPRWRATATTGWPRSRSGRAGRFLGSGRAAAVLDDSQVAFLEDMMWAQGYLDRPQMSRAFASIRAEDLIYARAVRRYFLGVEDMPSDLTVWNNDTTRMPARMHSEYLRGLFLENRLTAGRFAVEGRVIALGDIRGPLSSWAPRPTTSRRGNRSTRSGCPS
jgi:polyhydroxyalkanoate synthase